MFKRRSVANTNKRHSRARPNPANEYLPSSSRLGHSSLCTSAAKLARSSTPWEFLPNYPDVVYPNSRPGAPTSPCLGTARLHSEPDSAVSLQPETSTMFRVLSLEPQPKAHVVSLSCFLKCIVMYIYIADISLSASSRRASAPATSSSALRSAYLRRVSLPASFQICPLRSGKICINAKFRVSLTL